MNYLRAYCKLVRKEEAKGLTKKEAKKQGLYVEGHHVFPCSLYGKTNEGNRRIVYVSARVHYILHALLEKAFIKRYGLEHWKTRKMTFAHIGLKGGDIGKKYVNSNLYDEARKRLYEFLKNRKMSDEMKKQISLKKKGKYIGRESSGAIPLRIYYNDGRIITYLEGIGNFSKEYGYPLSGVKSLINLKINSYRDIIKIERLPKPKKKVKPKQPFGRKVHNTIPIRIYFADGRVLDCPDGATHFSKNNPQYIHSAISRIRKGVLHIHKDIIKVEELIEGETKNIIPIKIKYPKSKVVPIRVYFEDGRIIEEENGPSEFSKKYPKYKKSNLSALSLNRTKKYKDIIKVERLKEL